MTNRITLFTWEDAGDAVCLKTELIKAWRPRIKKALQQGTYRIVSRPTGKYAEYYWNSPPGVKLSKGERKTIQETIAVDVLFSAVSDAVWFKLAESYFIGGGIHENASRLEVEY